MPSIFEVYEGTSVEVDTWHMSSKEKGGKIFPPYCSGDIILLFGSRDKASFEEEYAVG